MICDAFGYRLELEDKIEESETTINVAKDSKVKQTMSVGCCAKLLKFKVAVQPITKK